MTRVRWAERPGAATSEDRIFVGDDFVVVLDGASQADRTEHNGGWYATTLGTEIHQRLAAHADAGTVEVVAESIAAITARHGLVPGSSPSSTLSILRWTRDTLEAFVLGDSPIIIAKTDGSLIAIRDDRLATVARPQRQALRAAILRSGFDADHTPQRRALVAAQRLARNQPGGYWIGEATPEAAHHAETGAWPPGGVEAALVVTDGVAADPDKYGIPPTWAEAVAIARTDPAMLIETVHTAELSDPDGRMWPRSKRHDDKAAAIITADRGNEPR